MRLHLELDMEGLKEYDCLFLSPDGRRRVGPSTPQFQL